MAHDWFTMHKSPVFTAQDFAHHKEGIIKDLPLYEKYLSKRSKILDVGCGVGSKAVPLSTLGYNVVGIDNDKRVVAAAKKNAENFGGDLKILEGDITTLGTFFQKDSFDACLCAGVLEHFSKEEARNLVDMQLKIAPIVIAIMPLQHAHHSHEGAHAVHAHFWSEPEWVNIVFKGYNVVEHFARGADERHFNLLYIIFKRQTV